MFLKTNLQTSDDQTIHMTITNWNGQTVGLWKKFSPPSVLECVVCWSWPPEANVPYTLMRDSFLPHICIDFYPIHDAWLPPHLYLPPCKEPLPLPQGPAVVSSVWWRPSRLSCSAPMTSPASSRRSLVSASPPPSLTTPKPLPPPSHGLHILTASFTPPTPSLTRCTPGIPGTTVRQQSHAPPHTSAQYHSAPLGSAQHTAFSISTCMSLPHTMACTYTQLMVTLSIKLSGWLLPLRSCTSNCHVGLAEQLSVWVIRKHTGRVFFSQTHNTTSLLRIWTWVRQFAVSEWRRAQRWKGWNPVRWLADKRCFCWH